MDKVRPESQSEHTPVTNGNLDGAAGDLTIVRPAAAAPPRRLNQI